MMTFTLAERMIEVPFGIIFFDPLMATGTMGTPAFMANLRPPALKGPTVPSALRVPSGKITIECPALSRSAASLMADSD